MIRVLPIDDCQHRQAPVDEQLTRTVREPCQTHAEPAVRLGPPVFRAAPVHARASSSPTQSITETLTAACSGAGVARLLPEVDTVWRWHHARHFPGCLCPRRGEQ